MKCYPQSEQSHRRTGGSTTGNPGTGSARETRSEGKQLSSGASARNVPAVAEDLRTPRTIRAMICTKTNGRISRSANRITIPAITCTTKDLSGVRNAEGGFRKIANVGPVSLQRNARQQSTAKNSGEEIGTHITGYELRKRTGSGRLR